MIFVLYIQPVFPSKGWGIRGTTSIQSTSRAKPGPWKRDLRGSQLITEPILSQSHILHRQVSAGANTLSDDLKDCEMSETLHECLWKHRFQSNRVTWLKMLPQVQWSKVTKEQEI